MEKMSDPFFAIKIGNLSCFCMFGAGSSPSQGVDEGEVGPEGAPAEGAVSWLGSEIRAVAQNVEGFVDQMRRDPGIQDWSKLNEKFETVFGYERPDIRHVVVLMLENRTFDGVQGNKMNERYRKGEVKRSKWDTDGKDLYEYSNKVTNEEFPEGVDFPVWTLGDDDEHMLSEKYMCVPSGPAGPVEKFHFLNLALYEKIRPSKDDVERGPTMGGFAQQYYNKELANLPPDGTALEPETSATCFNTKRSPAMYVYHRDQMAAFSEIMDAFGCSDTHFASAPCQTWPNRLFAVCGTAFGYYNNIPYVNPEGPDETTYFQSEKVDIVGALEKMLSSYDTDTVFQRLENKGVSWAIYQGQASLAVITTHLKHHPSRYDRVKSLDDFQADCEKGELPNYCWLEPRYDPTGDPPPNDMHPPANVLHGEKLIRDVYAALRSNDDIWKHTLYIVTCDEGVGSFDHIRPPKAKDPVVGHDHTYVRQDDGSPYDMAENPFERYGTRVPNLLISPYIKEGTVVRPEGHDEPGKAPYPFCHASIIRTAFDLLLADPEEHLTDRDKHAPSFVHALKKDRGAELNLGPETFYAPDYNVPPSVIRGIHTCHAYSFCKQIAKDKATQGHEMHTTLQNQIISLIGF